MKRLLTWINPMQERMGDTYFMVRSSLLVISTFLSAVFGVVLASPSHAQEVYWENSALLAITHNHGCVAAGMMCNEVDASGTVRMSLSPEKQGRRVQGDICRPGSSSILNPDVLAFEVTAWSRQDIAKLAAKLHKIRDPLNYDFSRVRLAGHRVRKVDENQDEDDLEPPAFDLGSGCYLLIKLPISSPFHGS